MKSLRELFPRASQEFIKRNPMLVPSELIKKAASSITGRKSGMNKTETECASILEVRKRHGEIVHWQYEGVRLKLAEDCHYTPDFFVIVSLEPLKLLMIEVKGRFIFDDALVKFKIARSHVNWARMEFWQKTKDGWVMQ